MAFATQTHTGDGVTTDFPVSFDYLDRTHVVVRVDKIDTTDGGSTHQYTWLNDTTIRVTTLGASPAANGAEIEFIRRTPITSPAVVFGPGVSLSGVNLNTLAEYLTYALQEATDADDRFTKLYLGSLATAPSLDNEGEALQEGAVYWNATSDRLFYWDGAAWIAADDVAAAATAASASETAAAASAAAAATSETNAASSASAAASSASTAATSEANAVAAADELADAFFGTGNAIPFPTSRVYVSPSLYEFETGPFPSDTSEVDVLIHDLNVGTFFSLFVGHEEIVDFVRVPVYDNDIYDGVNVEIGAAGNDAQAQTSSLFNFAINTVNGRVSFRKISTSKWVYDGVLSYNDGAIKVTTMSGSITMNGGNLLEYVRLRGSALDTGSVRIRRR